MSPSHTGTAKVIVNTYSGKEARTILAQARGYREIVWLMLNGTADRDPDEFIQQCKVISQRQAEEGA